MATIQELSLQAYLLTDVKFEHKSETDSGQNPIKFSAFGAGMLLTGGQDSS